MRWLISLHRYLGIGLGWLLVAWCVSGIVMMYVAYPELSERESLAALPALEFAECCRFELPDGVAADEPLGAFSIEMLGRAPVAELETEYGRPMVVDLVTGRRVDAVDAPQAMSIAQALASDPGQVAFLEMVDRDQWTVSAAYDHARPLYRFAANDAVGTQWYLSSSTGELVLATTSYERFWNWIGAVTHWLYPTLLRQNGALWSQVVIWSSLVGVFLTVFGIYIGVARLKLARRWSRTAG